MDYYGSDITKFHTDHINDLHYKAVGYREDILVNGIRHVEHVSVKDNGLFEQVIKASVICDDGRKAVVSCVNVRMFYVGFADVERWDIKASSRNSALKCWV